MPKRLIPTKYSPCTHRSSVSRSLYVSFFLDFRRGLFNSFGCVTPFIDNVTVQSSESEDDYDYDYEDEDERINNFENNTTCTINSETSNSNNTADTNMIDDGSTRSQEELSTVFIMGFDAYGKLKNSSSVKSKSISDEIETPLGLKQQKQQEVEGRDGNSFIGDKSPSTSSCRVLKRLKEDKKERDETNENEEKSISDSDSDSDEISCGRSFENEGRSSRKWRGSSGPSITGSLSWSVTSSLGGTNRHRNRDALKRDRQTQNMFSFNTKNAKSKKTAKQATARGWFKRKLRDSSLVTKRHDKVADCSVMVTSVHSAPGFVQERSGDNIVSILRNSKINSQSASSVPSEPGSPTVRFAEGTVFQDPNQVRRRKVPRIKGSKSRRSKRYSSFPRRQCIKKAPQSTSLHENMTTLSIDNGASCNAMAPLVSAIGCF